ncbi:uncharacterized protein PGTG_05057 [Puccinia graminis f. sp. tritici CRL 75-36-700-3]|uniref:Uncharacterized protein n=1 Tax=Puccinia graminis f. sp. tritici (strain CRL 75-36-700-3 / race SCCL) TaxID=418459 RepID=E3K6A1_PUCGT|nr:uncharacterized protein PGTG_05057 [Puccinia graminis f. sp. tritici CRL 75-36-700-3]EFP79832.1 hypothetical protein PGTG_05057 [Puccinia graminis f. sp. tritici CRL 75-36-700-3]
MLQLAASRLIMLFPLLLVALQSSAKPTPTEGLLVCSGSAPVGKIAPSSGAYYAISDTPHNASGKCSCDHSTGRLDCAVAPKFPISTPQGPAVCQSPGKKTCDSSNIFLCQSGKLIGSLNSEGGFSVTGQSDKASGYCQCDAEGRNGCSDVPITLPQVLSLSSQKKHIDCSKKDDCSGL